MQCAHPPTLEIGTAGRTPCLTQDVVRSGLAAGCKQRDYLMHCVGPIKRLDQRLDDARACVGCTYIRPAFERMRERQMPSRYLRRFIGIAASMNGELRSPNSLVKFEIGRGIEGRIHADQEQ